MALKYALIIAALVGPASAEGSRVRSIDIHEVCTTTTRQLRHWTRERDERLFAEYGVDYASRHDYELNHIIPLSWGGSDDDANQWPEPRASIELYWNAERKDALERKGAELICSGQLDIQQAQREISANWCAMYVRLFPKQNEPAIEPSACEN